MIYQNTDIIKLSDNVLSSQLGDESVILDHQHGLYFGLEGVGSFVWEKIQEKEMTVAEIKEAVLEEFEADEATVDADMDALLAQLKEEQLIL
jgi:Coenzyme PQQ synthesis protein D (PqqD)